MCLVQVWNARFFAICMQLWLSHFNFVGCFWIALNILQNHPQPKCLTRGKESCFVINFNTRRAMVGCSLLIHETTPDPSEKLDLSSILLLWDKDLIWLLPNLHPQTEMHNSNIWHLKLFAYSLFTLWDPLHGFLYDKVVHIKDNDHICALILKNIKVCTCLF